jgi:short subunit fatty acids transporter
MAAAEGNTWLERGYLETSRRPSFVLSGSGKWVIDTPCVRQAAITLHVHLGWVVQISNATAALPNLVNLFRMLPLLGVLGVGARGPVRDSICS